ncbi:MAG: TfoX family protein [Calditrichaeota bacterium]|nr:TfoX/Sxy family protein [Calditrichota bacterium]RQW07456.1 MAG: TfoX family protein [Calditrichota bacterium]
MSDAEEIRVRKMFGGYGIFIREAMIGLVSENILYLKADNQSSKKFEERGLRPFTYFRKGRKVKLSYYQAPEETLEDREAMQKWMHLAYEAALRSAR